MHWNTIKRIYNYVLKLNLTIKYFGNNKYFIKWPDGHEEWWLDEVLHRKDGPAITTANGDRHWYLNGKSLTGKEFKEEAK